MTKTKYLTVKSGEYKEHPANVTIETIGRVSSKGQIRKVEYKLGENKFKVMHGAKGKKVKIEVKYILAEPPRNDQVVIWPFVATVPPAHPHNLNFHDNTSRNS